MPSNAKKGTYYKLKTKKWLIEKGFEVEYIEKLQRIVTKEGKVINIKRDLFASDILAMNGEQLIFVQVKFGRKNIADAFKQFELHKFPMFATRWVVVWEERVREPEVIDATPAVMTSSERG